MKSDYGQRLSFSIIDFFYLSNSDDHLVLTVQILVSIVEKKEQQRKEKRREEKIMILEARD
jgi:hypothetical protein